MRAIASTLLIFTLLTGCSGSKEKTNDKPHKDDHDHGPGPHKGTIIEFCGGKIHLEFTVDHDKQEVRIYALDGSAKKAKAIKCDKLTVHIKNPAFDVELKPERQKDDPEGMCSQFAAKHEKFGKHQEFAGTVSGVVDGKPCSDDFEEKDEPKQK